MKKTPWFPSHVEPVRKGVYERQEHPATEKFSFWNGKHWLSTGETPDVAYVYAKEGPSVQQELRWRGILKGKP